MYEVIQIFKDLQDFDHFYNVGDIFPREGMQVSEERLKELSGSHNKQHRPLIKKITDETDDIQLPFSDDEIMFESGVEEKKYTKTDINRMTTVELQNLAAAEGIENAFEKSGGQLKKILIEFFNL